MYNITSQCAFIFGTEVPLGTAPQLAIHLHRPHQSRDRVTAFTRFRRLSSGRQYTAWEPRVIVYWCRRSTDAVQSAAAQHDEDGRSVAFVVSSAASDLGWTIKGGPGPCSARPVCSKSGFIFILTQTTPVDEYSHHTNCFLPFYCFATNTQHRSIRQSTRRAVTHSVTESRNESRLGWRFWRTAVRMDLHHSI